MYTNPSYSGNVINLIKDIKHKKYLELGIDDNINFNGILAQDKTSVDTNGRAVFTGTTDNFFAQLNDDIFFDVIFIDANHDYEYVLKDFNNCVKHCKEWIALHDMVPPTLYHTYHTQCSDSYKILHYMIQERPDLIRYTLQDPIFYGLTFIKMPAKILIPNDTYRNINYDTFMQNLKGQKLYSKDEMALILGK